MAGESAESLLAAIHVAHAQHLRAMLVESAGLFWLFAELVILFAVQAGRAHLESVPLPPRLRWTPKLLRTGVLYATGFLLLFAFTYGRHLVWTPVYVLLERGLTDTSLLYAATLRRSHEHMMLWAAFVAGWVALEILIVYHGWRGYRALRRALTPENTP